MKSTDHGKTWTTPVALAGPTEGCQGGADIAVSGQRVVVAWRSGICGGVATNIKVRISNDAGATWSPITALTSTPQTELPPSIAIDGNDVIASWLTPRSQDSTSVDYATSADGGATWTTPTSLTDIGKQPLYGPTILAPGLELTDGVITLSPPAWSTIYSSEDLGTSWTAIATTLNGIKTVKVTPQGYLAINHAGLEAFTGAPLEIPGAPTGVTAEAMTDGAVQLAWTAPSNGATAPVYDYTVHAYPGDIAMPVGGTTSAEIRGLTPGTSYTFTVTARNTAGTGPHSASSNEIVTAAPPSKPAAPTALPDDTRAVVSWAASSANGSSITQYTVTSSPGGHTCVTSGALTCVVQGLTNGSAYTFTLVASNVIGASTPSAPSSPVTPVGPTLPPTPPGPNTPPTSVPTATPTSAPTSAPTPTVATAPAKMPAPRLSVRNGRVTVKWNAAADGGSPITIYVIDISKGRDQTRPSDTRKTVFKRLKPGRYRFRIAARNAVGTSPYSTWVRVRLAG